jgi:DNA gyrase/topoisomerase IV subunit A
MRYTEDAFPPGRNAREYRRGDRRLGPNFVDPSRSAGASSRFPNLLVNGSTGIAGAWPEFYPPNNLKSGGPLSTCLTMRTWNWENLLHILPGPDLPPAARFSDGTVSSRPTGRARQNFPSGKDTRRGRQAGNTGHRHHRDSLLVNKTTSLRLLSERQEYTEWHHRHKG